MTKKQTDILILGAGLSGLALAYYLKKRKINALVLDARDRLGGRIHTTYREGKASVEMGATWFNSGHTALLSLLKELDLEYFEQHADMTAFYQAGAHQSPMQVPIPANQEGSYRIEGGSFRLIQTLASALDAEQLLLGEKVLSVQKVDEQMITKTSALEVHSLVVVSTLPLNLMVSSVTFDPILPQDLIALSKQTHTWMGESIKIGLRSRTAFWRKAQSTGTLFTNTGPLVEMYDHSDSEASVYALKGFLHPRFYGLKREQRKELVDSQLRLLYGSDVDELTDYEEYLWQDDELTFAPYQTPLMGHQNNGHPLFQEAYMEGGLFLAGTETAREFPGYMEGAVRKAMSTAKRLLA